MSYSPLLGSARHKKNSKEHGYKIEHYGSMAPLQEESGRSIKVVLVISWYSHSHEEMRTILK